MCACLSVFESLAIFGLTRLEEGTLYGDYIKECFYLGIGKESELAKITKIVAIHKNNFIFGPYDTRPETFKAFAKMVADKCGGDANLSFAWYGTSRSELCLDNIMRIGFSQFNIFPRSLRSRICLSPANCSSDSVLSAEVDKDGIRHVILCRVILGKQEVVTADSNPFQFHPTSPEFDSGVDDLVAPKKYFMWSVYRNTHILPVFIVSFKISCSDNLSAPPKVGASSNLPPLVNYKTLLPKLYKLLTPSQAALLKKHYNDYVKNKIPETQFRVKLKWTIMEILTEECFAGGNAQRS